MGFFDSFKNKKQPATGKGSMKDQFPEIVRCYNDFFSDIAKPLKESKDKEKNARLIGKEIPIIAGYDLQNFNTLLFNNMRMEIKEKGSTFIQEQSTVYVLIADRYLFSKLGREDRDVYMEALENGYLNGMMNRSNHNELAWHYFRQVIIEREKEFSQCKSIEHLLIFYQVKLFQRLEIQDASLVSTLFYQMIFTGTMMFISNMLSNLVD